MRQRETAAAHHKRHARRIGTLVWIALCVLTCLSLIAVANLLTALVGWVNPGLEDPRIEAADIISGYLARVPAVGDMLGPLLVSLGLDRSASAYLNSIAGLVGLLVGLVTMRRPARALYDRLLVPFDLSIFTPIRPPRAIDPLRPVMEVEPDERVMPWYRPVDGARAEAWNALTTFAMETEDPFAYQLLLGGPGAGKSRLAVEFARQRLALLQGGCDDRVLPPREAGGERPFTWKSALRTWFRIQLLNRPPSAEDPWDIGWLRAEMFDQTDDGGDGAST